jgi:hypothetical protein
MMNEDYMCPNCVTPWKCNGPHLEETENKMDETLVNKLVSTIYNSELADDLLVLKLEDELNSLVEDVVNLGMKTPLKDYEKEDLKHYLENCKAMITVLKYHTTKEYLFHTGFLSHYEDLLKEDDTDNKDQSVNLDLEEALYCAKLGLEIILHCNIAGIPTTELPELIRLRGEYLAQEEDPEGGSFTGLDLNNIPEPNEEMKKLREEYVAVRKAQAEKAGYEHG